MVLGIFPRARLPALLVSLLELLDLLGRITDIVTRSSTSIHSVKFVMGNVFLNLGSEKLKGGWDVSQGP